MLPQNLFIHQLGLFKEHKNAAKGLLFDFIPLIDALIRLAALLKGLAAPKKELATLRRGLADATQTLAAPEKGLADATHPLAAPQKELIHARQTLKATHQT